MATHGSNDPSIPHKQHTRLIRPPPVRCTARSSRTGEPCKRYASHGTNVCRVHGGAAPQVKAAARRRLDAAADVLVQRLLGFALDGDTPDNIALTAIRDALDRAGLGAKTAVSVEVGTPAYVEVFDCIVSTPVQAAHALEGPLPPTPEPVDECTDAVGVPVAEEFSKIVDAEVVDPPPPKPAGPAGNGLVDYETAVAQCAQVKRALGLFGPVRAIPPGRRRR